MNDLRRSLAPLADEAWEMVEQEARRTLVASLAARKLVDFKGPCGWQHSAVNLGRVQALGDAPSRGVLMHMRQVQPLLELRVPFTLARDEIDCISRGAEDPDMASVVTAARRLGLAEDNVVFAGFAKAHIRGLLQSSHAPISIGTDYQVFPRVIAEAMEHLREIGIAGPYAVALGPNEYNGLAKTAGSGGYPIIQHVTRIIDGPLVWTPGIDGGAVLSMRGGDFELTVGRDISVGYFNHDDEKVTLYLEESLTFRNLTPEAAVRLQP